MVRDDNSDAAWEKFVEATDKFHERLPKASTPHEFEYLRLLYRALLEAYVI